MLLEITYLAKKRSTIENIPTTQAALLQHLLRSMYQANCWQQMCVKSQKLLDPESFGWNALTENGHPSGQSPERLQIVPEFWYSVDGEKAAKETVNAIKQHWIIQLYVTAVEAIIRIQNVNLLVRLKYIVGYFTGYIFLHVYMYWP